MINKIIFIFFLLLLVYLSLFPRITETLSHNFVFGFDQGRDYLAAKSIVVDHKLTLIGSELGAGSAGLTGLFHGPFYFYLLSGAFLLFGGNPYGGIVVMFILGIATIVLSFFVGKKILGVLGGYVFALLIAASPPLIAQSRFFWNSYPSSVFIVLVFYFVYRSTILRKKFDIFLSAFFSAFIYNFQTGIAVPLVITFFLYSIFILRIRKAREYFLIVSGYTLAFLPLVLFELRHDFQGARGLTTYLFNDKNAHAEKFSAVNLLLDHVGSFFYNFSDSFPKTPFPWWLVAIAIFVPLFYFWYKEREPALRLFMVYLLCLPLVAFFVFIPLRNSVYPYYLYALTFVYLFFFAYVLSRAITKRNPMILATILILSAWFLLSASMNAYKVYSADVKDYGGDAKIAGKIDAIDYIYNDAKGKPFNILFFSPPVYTYPYDYLLWWHGKKQYNYVPGNEKKGTVYLLIEQDHTKPWSYKGWLETVIIEGRVEKTLTLPSGLIVQKRLFE